MTVKSKLVEKPSFRTLVGTPKQIRKGLDHVIADQVIAVILEHARGQAGRALAETVVAIAPLIPNIQERRQKEMFNSIVEALVPREPPPPHLVTEAQMTANAQTKVLESGDWITAPQIAKIAGFSPRNLSAQPSKWKKRGQIFAIHHRGVDYFPGYALDAAKGYRPIKELAKILAVFHGRKSDWGVAYWFASLNSFLGGKRPQDLLASHPDRVVAAAKDELVGPVHG
jgi:hypothetical protein